MPELPPINKKLAIETRHSLLIYLANRHLEFDEAKTLLSQYIQCKEKDRESMLAGALKLKIKSSKNKKKFSFRLQVLDIFIETAKSINSYSESNFTKQLQSALKKLFTKINALECPEKLQDDDTFQIQIDKEVCDIKAIVVQLQLLMQHLELVSISAAEVEIKKGEIKRKDIQKVTKEALLWQYSKDIIDRSVELFTLYCYLSKEQRLIFLNYLVSKETEAKYNLHKNKADLLYFIWSAIKEANIPKTIKADELESYIRLLATNFETSFEDYMKKNK